MGRLLFFFAVGCTVFGSCVALADTATTSCAIPTADVATAVVIRETPSAASTAVGRLAPGQQWPVSGEVPNWTHVTLSTESTGFVSKRWTDVVDCASHQPLPAPAHPNTGVSFELNAIDVGTGLSVFVKGPDFALLYDAGSNDDMAQGVQRGGQQGGCGSHSCPHCRCDDFIRSANPRRDEIVTCGRCGTPFTYGELEEHAVDAARKLLAKAFPHLQLD